MTTTTPPVSGARLPVIDAVRAVALFGVITMNIMAMVMVFAGEQVIAMAQPWDYVVAVFDLVLLQGKARSTFAFLFGVGFGLLMARTGPGFVAFYLRRMSVLLAIGVINMLFLFWGDILILYAILGMTLILFRTWSDRAVLTLGLILILAPPVLLGALEIITGGHLRGLAGVTPDEGWALIAARAPIYESGGYFEVVHANLAYYIDHHLFDTAYVAIYDLGVLGLFLTGLWTARKGIFADVEAWRPFLRRVAWGCLPVGLIVSIAYATKTMGASFGVPFDAVITAGYLGLPVMAFGYVAAFTLCFTRGGRGLDKALRPMGRMALTGYLGSNLIGGFVWYGWGLGLMGKIGLTGVFGVSAAIFAGLWLFSALWLKRFSFGPVEGVWRRLSGRRIRA